MYRVPTTRISNINKCLNSFSTASREGSEILLKKRNKIQNNFNLSSKQINTFNENDNDKALLKISKKNNRKNQNNFLFLGNIASLFPKFIDITECQNSYSCQLLNQIQCHFYNIWEQEMKHKTDSQRRFTSFCSFVKPDIQFLNFNLHLTSTNPSERIISKNIEQFILNPAAFLRKQHFYSLSLVERIIALFYIIKKNCLQAPVKCFCGDRLLFFIKKKSTKRKHELIRFCLKKYLHFIMDQTLNITQPNILIAKKKEMFFNLLGESIPGTKSNDLIKSYFNEGKKKTKNKKRRRVKNIKELILKLKTNTRTKHFFNKTIIEKNFLKIYEMYYPERKSKVNKIISQFHNYSILDVFLKCEQILKNKRFKLFFSHEDIRLGIEFIHDILNKLD
jgi:hypothetical protein